MASHWGAAFAGGAAAALLASGAAWFLTRPATYQECVVWEMRGQAPSMHAVVNKLCGQRFDIEFPVGAQVAFTWNRAGDAVTLKVKEPSREYRVTRAYVRFSHKACGEATEQDYSEEVPAVSQAGDVFEVRLPENAVVRCLGARATMAKFR